MRIVRVELLSSDLAAQECFYDQTLGLDVSRPSPDRLEIAAGDCRVVFRQAPAGWQGAYHIAFNIPHNLFPEAKAWLAGKTALLRSAAGADEFPSSSWNSVGCYFLDPASNVLELIARHDLHFEGQSPFNSQQILAVSEIGLGVPDVGEAVADLREQAGLEPYRDPAPDFAPVGDADGLLIVVCHGRTWFPDTGIPAQPIYTSAEVVNPAGESLWVVAGPGRLAISRVAT